MRRVTFEEPEDFSPLVADLYRWWYEERRLHTSRLLVESFILIEPWWTLRTGSVLFWVVFNMEPSAEALERYLDGTKPYDHIHLMLFSHGVDSIGLASIERWRSALRRASTGASWGSTSGGSPGFRDVCPLPHGSEKDTHALPHARTALPLPARRVPRSDD